MYKIYQPKNMNKKFLKLTNYIQGSEQLTLSKDYLVITSSLKDVMAFNKLGFNNVECIAPDSENSVIPEKTMSKLKSSFSQVIVIFDNDQAGINSMIKYEQLYSIRSVHLTLDKDVADCVKSHGVDTTRQAIVTSYKQKYG